MKRLLIHIGAILVVALIVGWACMAWLGSWTRHGEVAIVPAVKSMSFEKASQRLAEAGLRAELLDSVYETSTPPGSVLNQTPREGAKVKPGRTVYITVNAFTPKMVTVPSLTDNSVRQARTTLNGLGITNITERRVPSDFEDLVLGVIYKGTRLSPGARVPVNANIILEIGQGSVEFTDSISGGDDAPDSSDVLELV